MASPEFKRCLGCGYILNHLPEPRCPECGRAFDPHDARTYFTKKWSGLPIFIMALAAALLLLPPLVRFKRWFLAPRGAFSIGRYDLPLAAGVLLAGIAIVAGSMMLRGPPRELRWRGLVIVAVAANVVILLALLVILLVTWC